MSKTDDIISKYQRMIENIRWHLRTNEPTDKMEIQKCNQQINDYTEIINDLTAVASQFQQPAVPPDINGFSTNPELIVESLRESYHKETGNYSNSTPRYYMGWLENKIVEYRQYPQPAVPVQGEVYSESNVKELLGTLRMVVSSDLNYKSRLSIFTEAQMQEITDTIEWLEQIPPTQGQEQDIKNISQLGEQC